MLRKKEVATMIDELQEIIGQLQDMKAELFCLYVGENIDGARPSTASMLEQIDDARVALMLVGYRLNSIKF